MEIWKIFLFLDYCNMVVKNTSDFSIARILMRHFKTMGDFSIEQIAEEANISTASVSRFVKKAGFESFREFRDLIGYYNVKLRADRELMQARYYASAGSDAGMSVITERIFRHAMNNLEATRRSVDQEALAEAARRLRGAASVAVLGAPHELAECYTLQLDLFALGVPTTMFYDGEIAAANLRTLSAKDCVLVMGVSSGFSITYRKMMQETGVPGRVPVIAISQEPWEGLTNQDLNILYGIPGSSNDGYFSLFCLSQIISEALYLIP